MISAVLLHSPVRRRAELKAWMDHHGTHFVCLTGVELLVVPGLGDVVLPQGDGQVLDVLVLDAVAGRDDVLVVHQNSTALKIFLSPTQN